MTVLVLEINDSYIWRIVDLDNDSIWYAESRNTYATFSLAFDAGDYYLDSM